MTPLAAALLAISLIGSAHAASVKQYTSNDCSGTASHKATSVYSEGKHYEVDETTGSIKTSRVFDIWYAFEDTDACARGNLTVVLGTLKNRCHDVDTFVEGRRINCVMLSSNSLR